MHQEGVEKEVGASGRTDAWKGPAHTGWQRLRSEERLSALKTLRSVGVTYEHRMIDGAPVDIMAINLYSHVSGNSDEMCRWPV